MDNKENKFAKKRDIFIIIAILAIGIGLWLFNALNKKSGNVAIVSIGFVGETQQEIISLDKNATYNIDAALPVTLIVEDGSIYFTNAVCPDKLCEGFGKISHVDEFATCIPAEVVVKIESKEFLNTTN